MLSIRHGAIAFLSLIVVLFSGLHTASATEVTGTLSSDGRSEATEGSSDNEGVLNSAATQNNGQLQGVVTGGREDSAFSTLVWVLPVLAVIFVAFLYFFKRRGEI